MSEKPQPPSGERLAKVIARAGVCSRREAESWITEGRIAVNGATVRTPAFNVVEADTIAVDGKPLARRQATQLWLYHKPAGLMVTEKDPEGRPTVFEAFSRLGLPRLVTVGRLDFNTEGLLLLTNDGGLKRTLELPSTGWVRRYRVRAFGAIAQEKLDELKNGITVEGVEYGPIEATLDSAAGSNVWLTLALREGKNREVRNVLGALGLEVNRLIRLSYGPFQLGDLPAGAVEKVKTRILKDQLGKRLADQAGADFESPTDEDAAQPRRRAPEKPESRAVERDRFGGLRRRPDFSRPERPQARPRTIHFDDGRPPESFVPREPRGKGKFDRDDKPARPPRGEKRFEDGPRKDKRPAASRPYRERPEGEARRPRTDKPFARRPGGETRPARKEGDRPFVRRERTSDAPEGKRPYRARPEGEARRPRKDEDRPLGRFTRPGKRDKAFGDRPPRRDGDKPFARRTQGGKPPRRDGDKPVNKRPGKPPRPRKDEDE